MEYELNCTATIAHEDGRSFLEFDQLGRHRRSFHRVEVDTDTAQKLARAMYDMVSGRSRYE